MATEVIQKTPKTASVVRCGKCHRLLTDPVSLDRGYGPICWASVQLNRGPEEQRQPLVPPRDWDITEADLPWPPGVKKYQGARSNGGDRLWVYVVRPDGSVQNLKHIPYHSPAGFEWGYGGSGPADLARSILCDVAGLKLADTFYQQFKNEVVAVLDRDGWVLSEFTVQRWLAEKMEWLKAAS